MNAETNAPWESDECFPLKPAGTEYGYLQKGKHIACTQEELADRCSGMELPEIELVWHPGAPRLVPVWTVAFLQDALRTREKAVLRHNARVAGFNVLIFCLVGLGTHHRNGYFALVVCFGFFFGVLPLYESWRELRRFDTIKWDTTTVANPFDRYAAWVETRSTKMTWTLLGLIGAVGAAQVLSSTNSAAMAGLVKSAVWKGGQWWRVLTAPFLHGDLIHFMFNTSALLGLGRLTEALAGRFRLATIFGVSALGGGLLSLMFMPHTTSVGASGGLLGIIGFLIVLGVRRKALLPPGFVRIFAINVALLIVMGVVAYSVIDNAAHLGGFICGAITGMLMIPPQGKLPLPSTALSRTIGGVALAGLAGSALFAACKILGKI